MTYGHDLNNTDLSAQRLPPDPRRGQMLSWSTYLVLGILLFTIFYWAIPSWLNHELGTFQNNTPRPMAAALLSKRIYWIQQAGIVLGLVCIFFAIHNFLSMRVISKSSGDSTTLFSRLLARFID